MCDKKVFVVAAKRSAIGSMLDTRSRVHPADLGGAVVRALLESAKVAPEAVDEVIVGNILPAGNGQGIGRQVAIKGGIPIETPAYAVNMVCGSGMKAVINAIRISIQGGHGESHCRGRRRMHEFGSLPYSQKRPSGYKNGRLQGYRPHGF